MLNCHGCLRRALRAVIAESCQRFPQDVAFQQSRRFHHFSQKSQHSTAAIAASASTVPACSPASEDNEKVSPRHTQIGEAARIRLDKKTAQNVKVALRPSEEQLRSAKAAALRDLPWRNDPYQLSTYVRGRLIDPDPRTVLQTLELVRAAGRQMSCVVSWNHIIDYFISNGAIEAAMKILNEMKKRAQFPNEHTYNILFVGLGKLAEKNPSVKRHALSLYRSLHAANSKVKPNIRHSTALLNVLAHSRDMESMWEVLSKLPEKGENAPDAFTYTIVLRTLRSKDQQWRSQKEEETAEVEKKDPAELAETRQAAVQQARQIWPDVIIRWNKGELVMDEHLMVMMGELLLASVNKSDIEEVLTLAEEVAQIPRQTSLRQGSRVRVAVPKEQPDQQPETVEHQSCRPNRPPVKISNHTLTMILKACFELRQWSAAMKYWDLLVEGSGDKTTGRQSIKPDKTDYIHYLRILRAARSSSRAIAALREMNEKGMLKQKETATKCFKIALPSCWRNSQSPHAMRDAADMYALMMQTVDPRAQDCKTMLSIVQLMYSHSEEVDGIVETLRLMTVGPGARSKAVDKQRNLVMDLVKGTEDSSAARNDVVTLARSVVGAVDVVLKQLDAVRHRPFLESVRLAMSYLVQQYQQIESSEDAVAEPTEPAEPKRRKVKRLERAWQDGFGSAFPGEVDWTPLRA